MKKLYQFIGDNQYITINDVFKDYQRLKKIQEMYQNNNHEHLCQEHDILNLSDYLNLMTILNNAEKDNYPFDIALLKRKLVGSNIELKKALNEQKILQSTNKRLAYLLTKLFTFNTNDCDHLFIFDEEKLTCARCDISTSDWLYDKKKTAMLKEAASIQNHLLGEAKVEHLPFLKNILDEYYDQVYIKDTIRSNQSIISIRNIYKAADSTAKLLPFYRHLLLLALNSPNHNPPLLSYNNENPNSNLLIDWEEKVNYYRELILNHTDINLIVKEIKKLKDNGELNALISFNDEITALAKAYYEITTSKEALLPESDYNYFSTNQLLSETTLQMKKK